MLQLSCPGPPRGGGATGAFCSGPHSSYGPQKDQYTLIEQSKTLLKQSLHIFALGPLSFLGCPVHVQLVAISISWYNYLCVICIKLLNNITVYIAATVFSVTATATYSGTTITVTYDVSRPAMCTCQLNSMTPVPCKSCAHSSSTILISIHFRSLWTYVYQCS